MTELPKIVRERLQAAGGGGPHPDADLLAAFAEHSLAGRERESVLQHLAVCSGCREVVALAQPETEEGSVARVPPMAAKPGWMSWYRLTWAALAACLVVGAAVVFMQRAKTPEEIRAYKSAPEQYTEQDKVSRNAPAAPEKQTTSAAAPAAPAASEKKEAAQVQVAEAQPKPQGEGVAGKDEFVFKQRRKEREEARKADEVASAKVAGAPAGYTGGAIPNSVTSMNEVAEQPKPAETAKAAGAPSSTSAAVNGTMQSVPAEGGRADMGASRDQRAAAAPTTVMSGHAAMSQSPAATQAQAQAPAAPPAASTEAVEVTIAPKAARKTAGVAAFDRAAQQPLQWSVSDDGRLQESADRGATWAPVPVAKGVVFRAVSSVGPQVWAGGNTSDSGVVWHSADGGKSWKLQHKFAPTSDGSSVQIASVTFTDATHGKVIVTRSGLSTPQTWTTSDGGATWAPELSGR